ncbi:MAG TPA: hypothetical protein VGM62_06230 [Chthoniobacterales bacterium]
MAHNHQVGPQLLTRRPPVFGTLYRGEDDTDITGSRIRGGTWQEDDVTQSESELNEDEEVFNITAYNEGERVKCDFFPVAGFEPKVNDVLEETTASAALAVSQGIEIFETGGKRRWVLEAPVTRKQFSKRPLIYSLSLYRGRALDTTQIEVES